MILDVIATSASEVVTLWRYTNLLLLLLLLLLLFFDPGTQFPGNQKNCAMQYKQVQKSS